LTVDNAVKVVKKVIGRRESVGDERRTGETRKGFEKVVHLIDSDWISFGWKEKCLESNTSGKGDAKGQRRSDIQIDLMTVFTDIAVDQRQITGWESERKAELCHIVPRSLRVWKGQKRSNRVFWDRKCFVDRSFAKKS